jgi:hypothetical protein
MITNNVISLCNDIKKEDDNSDCSPGLVLDTRNVNTDFRRLFGRVRKDNGDGTLLIEYLDGKMSNYSKDSGIKPATKEQLLRYTRILNKNVESRSISGPTVEKMLGNLERWGNSGNEK